MFTVIVRDITERISKETELKVLSERLALALDSAELGCWELDLEKDVLIWNDQMYKMHGQKRLGTEPMRFSVVRRAEWLKQSLMTFRSHVHHWLFLQRGLHTTFSCASPFLSLVR